ncbi:glycosyltransferase [Gryllotalpicola reticulitermitis]|uniref:D-inositol 3-phosphate glycosyltransferase n=1 Tax=Gryllotalpicola reticulitermitis TaxID=1184153 RepID=A0ABV8Q569_9MICO
MRIAFVTETWKPSINGVVTRIASSIDELLAAGHEVLVVAPRTGAADAGVPAVPGLTVVRVPSFHISWVYGGQPWGLPMPRVRAALAAFAPDLVHVVGPFVLGIAGVLGARRLRLPLVCSFHTDIAAYSTSYHLGWSRPIIWRILAALHNAAALNLVTSRHSEALLTKHGVRGIRLWQRGVDLARFRPAEASDRPVSAHTAGADAAQARDDAAPPRALYVGRLADEKRISSLLPLARSGAVRLTLVGDGPDRARLEQEFAGTQTEFTGSLTGDALAARYATADVFVFTSTTETLGLVLIEALASGLPVVAVESPASTELLGRLPIARLVAGSRPAEFIDAVTDVLSAGTRDERAVLARREAIGWSWANATQQLLGYYAEVVAPEARARALPGSAVRGPDADSAHRS